MNFIGLQMVVTLRNPPGVKLRGTVSEVIPGQSLVLKNVHTVGTDKWMRLIALDANNIADVTQYKEPAPAPNDFPSSAATPMPAAIVDQPASLVFVDPAIVSLGKRPASVSRTTATASDSQPPPQQVSPRQRQRQPPAPEDLPALDMSTGPQPGQPGVIPAYLVSASKTQAIAASLQEEFKSLHIGNVNKYCETLGEQNERNGQDWPGQPPKRKSRKSRPNKTGRNGRLEEPPMDTSAADTATSAGRGKGWRQTPILRSTASFQPYKALRGNGKKAMADSGWASGDVTEEMGEFDFEDNLAKFDKRSLFDQLRRADRVDEADRLVSHNRKPKPGATTGGKNFHYSENVLDRPSSTRLKMADYIWSSEADDGDEGVEGLSGRDVRSSLSMRRTDSKSGTARRSQSRKASGAATQPQSRMPPATAPFQPGFYLVPSNRRVETVSALQMLNLENIAANEIGLTEDMMAENAGRGIAQVTLTALSDPAIQLRLGTGGPNGPHVSPASMGTVVVLAGNNKSGIRAVAAARHLRNKGVSVLVCVVGIEREQDLLEDMRQQVRVFKNMGGRIHSKIELFEHIRKASHPAPPVTLIVDALLGLAISFEELRTGDQATVYELIEWANRNEAFTLAVDVPTGIDPSSGKVSIIDGSRLYVKPRYVVSMGAPKKGLLEAMTPEDGDDDGLENGGANGDSSLVADGDEWKLFIVDLGLGAAVWRKAGTKLRRGVDFDDQWVLEMRYQGMADPDEADY
ncbi:YjeF N-terminal domain-like protein [Sodiomyces alkalinus F11]|uniref:Enhancer of mRNA-decapping protein 3 n=1 Tax=Sodiomyces alkalinus (strain CBS 110278 / VKM F-3762 / F11) TaxID=1314773 RepID=A0A3N2Q864_SODAK|nr:YjeF N-terminal domain-like protein [Sodiomyces alkalinus F11]ROT42825.1 YjeF N-terminal domain-like protein [Sodiomyces alkalinus F11]